MQHGAGDTCLDGALLLAAFGLGALPMLPTAGAAAEWLKDFVRYPWVRRGAGALVQIFGIYAVIVPGSHAGHGAGPIGHAPGAADHQ